MQAEQVWAAPKEPSERFLTCLVPNQCRREDPKHPQGSVTGVQTPPEIPPGKAAPCCGVGAAGQRVEKTFRRMFRNTETFSTGGVELLGVWGPSRGCLWGRESLSHLPAPCSCNVWLQGPHASSPGESPFSWNNKTYLLRRVTRPFGSPEAALISLLSVRKDLLFSRPHTCGFHKVWKCEAPGKSHHAWIHR